MLSLYAYNIIFTVLAMLAPLAAWALARPTKIARRGNTAAAHILTQAQEQASKVLHEASMKAQHIITSTQALKEDTEQAAQERFREGVDHAHTEIKKMLERVQVHTEHELQESTEHLTSILAEHVARLTNQLLRRTMAIERAMNEQAKSEQAQFHTELATLKEQTRRRYEERLQEKLPSILRTIVGHTLTTTDHEQLIREALRNMEYELLPKKTPHESLSTQQKSTAS